MFEIVWDGFSLAAPFNSNKAAPTAQRRYHIRHLNHPIRWSCYYTPKRSIIKKKKEYPIKMTNNYNEFIRVGNIEMLAAMLRRWKLEIPNTAALY
ncbi:hypothetical protein CEXT_204411 [Caerostris extrusa]|uniref:Ycf15 n=1 Tax=Caerostris extrusa TaxID=172846 RepID=A0AAV4XG29_CAEEX|nr:hypothetical protein CEXT_204411 [Caerostris extrusa]